MFTQTLQSRWFALALHAGLWLLLALVVLRLAGSASFFEEAAAPVPAAQTHLPVAQLAQLFANGPQTYPAADPNRMSPFATRHFTPAKPPAPAAPTTRKTDLVYQGYYQTGTAAKNVFLQLDGKMINQPLGVEVVPGLFLEAADLQTLTLTNAAGQTNVLKLNTKTTLEVPVK
jgi:hypothetical protein